MWGARKIASTELLKTACVFGRALEFQISSEKYWEASPDHFVDDPSIFSLRRHSKAVQTVSEKVAREEYERKNRKKKDRSVEPLNDGTRLLAKSREKENYLKKMCNLIARPIIACRIVRESKRFLSILSFSFTSFLL